MGISFQGQEVVVRSLSLVMDGRYLTGAHLKKPYPSSESTVFAAFSNGRQATYVNGCMDFLPTPKTDPQFVACALMNALNKISKGSAKMAKTKHWTSESDSAFIPKMGFDFIAQLEKKMVESNISQVDVAKQLGVSEGAVSKILSNIENYCQIFSGAWC